MQKLWEKGHFAKGCYNTQIFNVESPELDKKDCSFIDSDKEENYSFRKTFES